MDSAGIRLPPSMTSMTSMENHESDDALLSDDSCETLSDDDWDRGLEAEMLDQDSTTSAPMSPVSPTDPSNLIDPSLYQRVGFVVRSNVSKKTESIAELNLALHTLRAVWEAHCLPTDKQVMRYKSTDFLDIRLYRHEKSSLLQPGLDHGLLRLQSVLSREHSALVIAGIDGISNDTEELSQYLLSFKEDTMLYFFMGGKLEYKFTSKQLASELQVDPRNLFQSKSDVAMRLNMTKMAEHMMEKSWSMLRLLGSVDTYTDENGPRPVTRRMIKVCEAAAREDLQKKPGLSNVLMAHLDNARQELRQINESKRKFKAPLLAAAAKQQQILADIKSSTSIEGSD